MKEAPKKTNVYEVSYSLWDGRGNVNISSIFVKARSKEAAKIEVNRMIQKLGYGLWTIDDVVDCFDQEVLVFFD